MRDVALNWMRVCGWVIVGCVAVLAGVARAQGVDPAQELRGNPVVGARVEAARKLAARIAAGESIALQALVWAATSDPVATVRIAALDVLGASKGCERVRDALDRALRDPDEAVRAKAASVRQGLKCEPAGAVAPATKGGGAKEVARTRNVFFPTANTAPAGTASWEILDIAAWTFSYSFRDDLQLTVLTGPPVGAVAVMPSLRYSYGNDSARVAVIAQAGTFIPFVANEGAAYVVGGGVVGTFGAAGHTFTVGAYGYGAGLTGRSFRSTSFEPVVLLTAGASFRFSDRFHFVAEAIVPILPTAYTVAEAAVILYGLQIQGGRMFGTVGFAAPIAKGVGDFYKYLPLGVPMLSFGFTW